MESGCNGGTTIPVSSPRYADYVSPYTWSDTIRPTHFMVVGDLQPTTWLEEKLFGRRQNDDVRHAIVDTLLKLDPDMLLLLGDQVGKGESATAWKEFDTLMKPVVRAGVPIYAVVGNHDYGLITSKGIQECHARFPYSTRLPQLIYMGDSVVMIVLDSNIGSLTEEGQASQEERYQEALDYFDRDPRIRGVIVAAHHPPFTNSPLPIDRRVHDMFAPPFLKAQKTMLFLAGHIHSYEHFEVDGKTFIVSGGGGGPLRWVDTSAGRNYTSDTYRHGTMRNHHYIDITIRPEGIRGEVMMLADGSFHMTDGFAIRWRR